MGLGHLYLRKGDLGRALPVLERGMAEGRRWQIWLLLSTLISAVGHAYVLLGRVDEGMPLLEEGFKISDDRGAMLGHPLRILWLAEGYLVQGRADVALSHATRALELSRAHKERALQAWALHVLGEVASAADSPDVAAAEDRYQQAIALADTLGMRPADRALPARPGQALSPRRARGRGGGEPRRRRRALPRDGHAVLGEANGRGARAGRSLTAGAGSARP